MPSFCCPLVIGPKPEITRPFAGQRNWGRAPVVSALFAFAADVSVAGANMLALCGVSALSGAIAGAGLASATAGTADFIAEDRTPGMTRRSPTLSRVFAPRLLALAISPTGLP